MRKKLDILIINYRQLNYTKNLIYDLRCNFFSDYKLTIIDNNIDRESNSFEVFSSMKENKVIDEYIYYETNKPLNHIWNGFVESSEAEYIALLNNDMRVPNNFLETSVFLLDNRKEIGIVNHSTNKSNIVERGIKMAAVTCRYRQGWDMIFRRELWEHIPDEMKFYCGDDFIYNNIYDKGYIGAYIINSPIIHYCSKSKDVGGHDWKDDIAKNDMNLFAEKYDTYGKSLIVVTQLTKTLFEGSENSFVYKFDDN